MAHLNVFLKRSDREFLIKCTRVQTDPCPKLCVKERSVGEVFKEESRRNFPQALPAYRGFLLLRRQGEQVTVLISESGSHAG